MLLLAATGCGAADRLLHPVGRLQLQRDGAGPLLDVPAEARFCGADSTLSIVGANRSWSAAVALRTSWPAARLEFTIDSVIGAAGSAAVAARPLKDSVGLALTALHGTLRLDAPSRVKGSLDLVARGAGDSVHLVGRFEAPYATRGVCPAR